MTCKKARESQLVTNMILMQKEKGLAKGTLTLIKRKRPRPLPNKVFHSLPFSKYSFRSWAKTEE